MYTARRDGGIVRLEDTTGGMVVEIATHLGNLVYRMSVKGHDIVYFPFASPDDYAANPYGWYGIPLLAPWANLLDEPAFHAELIVRRPPTAGRGIRPPDQRDT